MSSFTKYSVVALVVFLACGTAAPFCRSQTGTFSNIFRLNVNGAYLGIQMDDVTAANMSQYKLSSERGVIVRSVMNGSPAEAAKLKEGDVILEFGGYQVWSSLQLSRLVQETPVGRKVELVVSRDGRRLNLTAQISNRDGRRADDRMELLPPNAFGPGMRSFRFGVPNPPQESPNETAVGKPRLGVTLQPLTDQLGEFLGVPNKKGALVVSVASGSPSAGKLKSGDAIIGADDTRIDSPEDLIQFIRNRGEGAITLKIIRNKKETTVVVVLPPDEDQKGYKL